MWRNVRDYCLLWFGTFEEYNHNSEWFNAIILLSCQRIKPSDASYYTHADYTPHIVFSCGIALGFFPRMGDYFEEANAQNILID